MSRSRDRADGADLSAYAPLASPIFTGTVAGVTATHVGLGNATNESKATMFTSPTFTGTPVTPILKLTPTATASAPAGTEGAMYYDSDLGSVMVHLGSAWNMISAGTASGGTVTSYTGYTVHTFTSSGTFILTTKNIGNINHCWWWRRSWWWWWLRWWWWWWSWRSTLYGFYI